MRLLTELPATWVLPGHGRRFQAQDSKQMQAEINNCIKWMEQEA